jgi:YidC/Oxa1 family membrane protein insertase
MQQKIMKYMMIFFAVMFFKVASGLCLYFIASSLWGITERKLLPKPPVKVEADGSTTPPVKTITVNSNGTNAAKDRKKNRGKR